MVREYNLYDFNYFKFAEPCFMTQGIVNVPGAAEKNVYSVAGDGMFHNMSIKSYLFLVLFNSFISLLILG